MKTLPFILLFTFLARCTLRSNDKAFDKKQVDSLTVKKDTIQQDTATYQIVTIEVNGQQFLQTLKDSTFNCLTSLKGDTIIKSENFYFKAEFLDINMDGFKDIRVFAFSNIPNQCDNYLFDNNLKTFWLVENCFLDIEKVKGTEFYFSYERGGCSDMNWESYLSKIENLKLIHYGYIWGQGCDYKVEENPQIIEIYKIIDSENDEKVLLEKLPYTKYIPAFGDKWDFIQKYWMKNYKIFEPENQPLTHVQRKAG